MRLLIGLVALLTQDEPLKERVSELVPRLVHADAGVRLAAELELSKLGEAALPLLPATPASEEQRAALERVRRAIAIENEADRIEMRLRTSLDESCELWKQIVETESHDELYERAQLVALKIRLQKAELEAVREGVLDPRQRLLRKLKLATDVAWAGRRPRRWTEQAAVLSAILEIPVELQNDLPFRTETVCLDNPARSLEELLENLTRQAGLTFVVTDRSIEIRKS